MEIQTILSFYWWNNPQAAVLDVLGFVALRAWGSSKSLFEKKWFKSVITVLILCLSAGEHPGWRHYVFKVVCLFHCCECDTTFNFGTKLHLDGKMNWWDFGGHRSKVKVTVTSCMSRSCQHYGGNFHFIWHKSGWTCINFLECESGHTCACKLQLHCLVEA